MNDTNSYWLVLKRVWEFGKILLLVFNIQLKLAKAYEKERDLVELKLYIQKVLGSQKFYIIEFKSSSVLSTSKCFKKDVII